MSRQWRGRRAGALWDKAATAAIGRPAVVFFGGAWLGDGNGAATLERGRCVIYLRPGLSADERWRVFLHEAGHHALGHVTQDVGDDEPPKDDNLFLMRWRIEQLEYEIEVLRARRDGREPPAGPTYTPAAVLLEKYSLSFNEQQAKHWCRVTSAAVEQRVGPKAGITARLKTLIDLNTPGH